MRGLVATVMVALVSGGLAGCVGGGPTLSPSPVVTSSSVGSPSPTWTVVQQGAIRAVTNYLQIWTDVAQHLAQGGWDRMREVAVEPTASNEMLIFNEWNKNGWHMEGGPVFEPDRVAESYTDEEGTRYYVYGCFDITNSRLVDQNGHEVGDRGADRRPSQYLVLHRVNDGAYLVAENVLQEGTC